MMLVRHSETFFCLSVAALGEWRREWQESVTARADYAAPLDASSKMPNESRERTGSRSCVARP
jgi:hypothetical protein